MVTVRGGAKKQVVWRLLPDHQDTNKGVVDLPDLDAKVHTMLTEQIEFFNQYVGHVTLVMAAEQT